MTCEQHPLPCSLYSFPTPHALAQWLHQQGVDTTTWGHGDAKTVCDLWHELRHGETTLRADPPLRIVHVVEVHIEQNNQYLIEIEQHFADGRIRARRRPPSEKMQESEDPRAAARRCLCEELAVPPTAVTLPTQEIPTRTVRDESGSYPNLTSEYTFYTVIAQVADLPTTSFITPNAAHAAGDPITAHRWAWVPK